VSFDLMLPCGLHVWVAHQPNGVGSEKSHLGEYLWCVESAKVFARSYAPSFEEAKISACRMAVNVLTESVRAVGAA
jgi:hypothetical protein